jgi:hypothetical protein
MLSPARNSNVPRSAGAAPSQCCSKLAPNVRSLPSGAKVASLTVKLPAIVLHPRPLPVISSPGALPSANGARCAPS